MRHRKVRSVMRKKKAGEIDSQMATGSKVYVNHSHWSIKEQYLAST
jgi:hypothetical protein